MNDERLQSRDHNPVDQYGYYYSLYHEVEGKGKFIAQAGGCGCFGEVYVRLQPSDKPGRVYFKPGIEVPPSDDYSYIIPKEYFSAIEAALTACQNNWPTLKYPAKLIDVYVTGGRYIAVDSSDFAFCQAAVMAWQNAIAMAEMKMELKLCTTKDK